MIKSVKQKIKRILFSSLFTHYNVSRLKNRGGKNDKKMYLVYGSFSKENIQECVLIYI